MTKPAPATASHDWRNPAMPVLRSYLMPSGERRLIVDPDYERRYREHMLTTTAQPNWRNDPTYNLRRKR